MSKRHADRNGTEEPPRKNGVRDHQLPGQGPQGEFEDEFEDEFESEDEILEAGVDGRPDEEREAEEGA